MPFNEAVDLYNRITSVLKIPSMIMIIFLIISPTTVQAKKTNADPENKQQVSRGTLVYNKFCSLCHGADLKGDPNWRIRKDNGKLPPPPHDETGHTWHHADELLFGITKFGLVPPYGPENYKTDMPAWGDTLSDEDIWAVLAFIKSRWPAEIQKTQKEINQGSFK